MSLDVQIVSLVFSFIFGFIFSIFFKLNDKIIYSSKKIIKVVGTVLIIFSSTILYFIILERINNGYLHFYEIMMIVLGFFLKNKISK